MITGLDLINEVEDRLGWRQTKTLDEDLKPDSRKMVRLLNRVLKSIQRLDDWPLLRVDAEMTTVAAFQGTDYLTITNGSTTFAAGVTTDGTLLFDDTMVGRAVQIAAKDTIYRIVSIESPVSCTLNKAWIDDTITDTSSGFKIVQDQYALPEDFDRPAGGWEAFLDSHGVEPTGPDDFKKARIRRGGSLLIAEPKVFTIYGFTANNYQQVIHMDPYPENVRIYSYSYYRDHPEIDTDNDRVLLPATKLDAIIEGMLYLATRDYTDDGKVQMVMADYMRSLNSAGGSPGAAEQITQMSPNMKHKYQRRAQWGRGVRVNWGSLFDRSDRVGFP